MRGFGRRKSAEDYCRIAFKGIRFIGFRHRKLKIAFTILYVLWWLGTIAAAAVTLLTGSSLEVAAEVFGGTLPITIWFSYLYFRGAAGICMITTDVQCVPIPIPRKRAAALRFVEYLRQLAVPQYGRN